ncbi:rhomboid family intramembrane serine protease [Anaerobacillus alkalidiazotrophicus]|uniref:Rhomboid family intramembrane serine protease n=1 Tax=Anaerobacillus alkalidiazotrophicus TaxID=472963 RepID=A0A1S2MA08_9BACI|nr:rhomboid family intramembrane serine protease [Anaerobacillus alkalidiazotrophicus]OIJ21541.1 rhomboid family intramembrane serine protease [Anaerobacillus alkalidiazotrophicus]
MFVRNESFRSFLRSYPVVSGIVTLHLILFLWMFLFPSLGGNLIFILGVGHNLSIAQGELWRLVTPIFMHISPAHFLFNSFSLVLFGPALERLLGKWRFISIYILTGILANVATFYIGGLGYSPHLGASGAIFGLFGIYLYMVLYRKDLIDQDNSQVVITILVIGLIMTFVNARINVYAHIFGLISGAALAPIFLFKLRRYVPQYRHVFDEGEISFNPNRWKNRRFSAGTKKKVFWIIFVLLVILGVIFR